MVVLAILVREEKEGMSEEKEAREGGKKGMLFKDRNYSKIWVSARNENSELLLAHQSSDRSLGKCCI